MPLNKKATILNIISNSVITILVIVGFIIMWNTKDPNTLSAGKWGSLKFFTVQSNILMAIGCVVSLFYLIFKKDKYPLWVIALKISGLISVTITFMTTMLYLAPLMGLLAVLKGANLFFHLIVPLIAIAHYCLLEPKIKYPAWFLVFGASPVTIYGIAYLINVVVHNDFGNAKGADWYMFGAKGIGPGIGVLLGLIAIAIGLSMLFRLIHQKTKIKKLFE